MIQYLDKDFKEWEDADGSFVPCDKEKLVVLREDKNRNRQSVHQIRYLYSCGVVSCNMTKVFDLSVSYHNGHWGFITIFANTLGQHRHD